MMTALKYVSTSALQLLILEGTKTENSVSLLEKHFTHFNHHRFSYYKSIINDLIKTSLSYTDQCCIVFFKQLYNLIYMKS